jgi:hypothetical protein
MSYIGILECKRCAEIIKKYEICWEAGKQKMCPNTEYMRCAQLLNL